MNSEFVTLKNSGLRVLQACLDAHNETIAQGSASDGETVSKWRGEFSELKGKTMTNDIRFITNLATTARKHAIQARKAVRKALAAGKAELAAMYARDADFWTRRRVERLATIAALKAEVAS